MKISEVLDAAATLIEPPGKWTQGELARNAEGDETGTYSDDAVCFCLEGAVRHVAGHALNEPSWDFLASRLMSESLVAPYEWNDDRFRTQPEVVAKLREIAAQARAEGK